MNHDRRFCLTLDLKDDPALIAEYPKYHENIWPGITQSIRDAGIEHMQVYLRGTRMFMITDVNHSFCFEAKTRADRANHGPAVGGPYVEIPAGPPRRPARREMAAHGAHLPIMRRDRGYLLRCGRAAA